MITSTLHSKPATIEYYPVFRKKRINILLGQRLKASKKITILPIFYDLKLSGEYSMVYLCLYD